MNSSVKKFMKFTLLLSLLIFVSSCASVTSAKNARLHEACKIVKRVGYTETPDSKEFESLEKAAALIREEVSANYSEKDAFVQRIQLNVLINALDKGDTASNAEWFCTNERYSDYKLRDFPIEETAVSSGIKLIPGIIALILGLAIFPVAYLVRKRLFNSAKSQGKQISKNKERFVTFIDAVFIPLILISTLGFIFFAGFDMSAVIFFMGLLGIILWPVTRIAVLIADLAERKSRSFVAFFWLSILISPLITWLIVSSVGKEKDSSRAGSSADELRKLNDLFKEGILTQEEFDKKKQEILGL